MTGSDKYDPLFGPESAADTASWWTQPMPGYALTRYNGEPCAGCVGTFFTDPNCGRPDCPSRRGGQCPYAAAQAARQRRPVRPSEQDTRTPSDLYDEGIFRTAASTFQGQGHPLHIRGHTAYRGGQALPQGVGGGRAPESFNTAAPIVRALGGARRCGW